MINASDRAAETTRRNSANRFSATGKAENGGIGKNVYTLLYCLCLIKMFDLCYFVSELDGNK